MPLEFNLLRSPLWSGLFTPIFRGTDGSALAASSGGPQLPSGYDGLWYASDYVSSPRKQIPNRVDPSGSTSNLFTAPRRLFNNTEFWNKNSATVTDDAATDDAGVMEASTVNGTGNWYLGPSASQSFPAGTYTAACSVKRNAGGDQQFAFTGDNTATRSAAKTATGAWQRFSYTFTRAGSFNSNVVLLCSTDGVTNANIQIADFELYAGSSDLGPESLSGSLVLGATQYDSEPTVTGNVLDLSNGGWGLIQLPEGVTGTSRTVCAVVSKTAAGTTYQALLSKVQDYQAFSAMSDRSNTAQEQFLGAARSFNTAGLWRLLNRGYHLLSVVGDSSGCFVYLDKSLLFSTTTAMGSVTVRDLWCGVTNAKSLTTGLKLQVMATWPSALTQAQIGAVYDTFENEISTAMTTSTRIYVAEGDSITAVADSYAYQFGANASPAVIGSVKAVSGSTLASLNTRAADVDLAISSSSTSDFVLSVLIGANDLSGYATGAAGYITDLADYCDDRRAAGWKVVVCTILPTTNATHNTRRAIVNADIAGWVGVHCDAIADFAANGSVGDDADASNLTYYSDGVHPTAAGHAILEPILRSAINGL